MSLLSDRLLISLSPTALSWVRLRGVLRQRAVAKGSIDADPAHGDEPWAGVIAALRATTATWHRDRVAVTVVLSNHFVRYALVERPDSRVSRAEELALARFRFTRLHGARAAAWDVQVAAANGVGPRVASAVDGALLEAIKAAFPREGRPKLKSVQPYLVCAFNHWRARLEAPGAWLVLVEPGRVCLAMLAGKAWAAVQSVRSSYELPENWLDLLEREKHRTPVQPVPTAVFARASVAANTGSAAARGWRIAMLEAPDVDGITVAERESYAMALHAA